MDESSDMSSAPALPLEAWKLVADHMSTKEWCRVRHTCRTMADVQPRRITLRLTSVDHFKWVAEHWAEADVMKIDCDPEGPFPRYLEDVSTKWLEKYSSGCQLTLRWLHISFSPMNWDGSESISEPDGAKYDPYYYLVWLIEIIASAPQLSLLHIKDMGINGLPGMSRLKHLLLDIKSPLTQGDCSHLQELASLETLYVAQNCGIDTMSFYLPALDLRSCTCLRAVMLCRLSIGTLQVPEGCMVSMAGNIANLARDWPLNASLSTACYFQDYRDETAWDYDEEMLPDVRQDIGCLTNTICHNLTCLQLDSLKLCSWDHPIMIGSWLKNLERLTIKSKSVNICFTVPISLQTFVAVAEECVTLQMLSEESVIIDSLASSLTRVYSRFRCCCRNSYTLLGCLKEPCRWTDGWGWTRARMSAGLPGPVWCACDACPVCLQHQDVFLEM